MESGKQAKRRSQLEEVKMGHTGGKWQTAHSLRIKKDHKEGIALGFVELQKETILEKGEGT